MKNGSATVYQPLTSYPVASYISTAATYVPFELAFCTQKVQTIGNADPTGLTTLKKKKKKNRR